MNAAFKIAMIYGIFSSVWIIFSDRVIAFIASDIETLTIFSSMKGLFFVSITSIMLFFLIRKEIVEKNRVIKDLHNSGNIQKQLIQELHHRIKNNLQAVLSFLNLETADNNFSMEVKERLINKLISMKAVFNIVYNIQNMSNIYLETVVQEYTQLIGRALRIECRGQSGAYSVETVGSLLLIIDFLLEAFPSVQLLNLLFETPYQIYVYAETVNFTAEQIPKHEYAMLLAFASSINASLEFSESDKKGITLQFEDTNNISFQHKLEQ